MAKNTARTVPEWEKEPFMERVNRCRAMLVIHGFLTEKESKNVVGRIVKAMKTNATKAD